MEAATEETWGAGGRRDWQIYFSLYEVSIVQVWEQNAKASAAGLNYTEEPLKGREPDTYHSAFKDWKYFKTRKLAHFIALGKELKNHPPISYLILKGSVSITLQ